MGPVQVDGKTWVSFPDNQGELRDTWQILAFDWRFRDEFDDTSLIGANEVQSDRVPTFFKVQGQGDSRNSGANDAAASAPAALL